MYRLIEENELKRILNKVLEKCFNKSIVLPTKYHVLISIIIALISILTYLVVLLIVFKNSTAKNGFKLNAKDGTHGTADWMTDKEAEKVLGLNNEPGILLGKKNGKPVVLPFKSYFNKNILVLGSPGSMKSIAFILLNILPIILGILVWFKSSVAIKNGKRDGITLFIQIFNAFFI